LLKFCINVDNLNEELNLTLNEIKYLKLIFSHYEKKEEINISTLSQVLGIKPPSALDTLKNLEEKGLIKRERGKIFLSEKGKKFMKYVSLKRRILELFFYHFLGLEVKKCKYEADKIDYLLSCEIIYKITKKLERVGINLSKCVHSKPTYVDEFYKIIEEMNQ